MANRLQLLYGVFFSLPFTAIRLIYATVSIFVESAALNQVTGKLAIRVCLGMLPELIVIIIFIAAGLLTWNINKAAMVGRDIQISDQTAQGNVKKGFDDRAVRMGTLQEGSV